MSRNRPPFSPRLAVALGAAFLGAAMLHGCGQQNRLTGVDVQVGPNSNVVAAKTHALLETMKVQNRHNAELMAIDGVVGIATAFDASGKAAVMVLTERSLGARLPAQIEGVGVFENVTGKIHALKGGGGGVSHTAKQTPPIQLGCSGSPTLDIANGYCCGGTLGSLVSKGGSQYILSNSHVFAGDVVSGGNGRVATVGDDVTQPGLIDIGCVASGGQVVADVSTLSTLYPPNSTPNVDCSIAQVRSGMVRTDGAILEVGTLSASTVAAFVGQSVKKSGRTTGLTRSSVSGLNATITVGYEDECAGTAFNKTFTGQILISNNGSRFLNSGDSGSLMVEDVATNPRAVGLLFAGGGSIAVANPIGAVLSHLGATMVGQ